jgi:hypothetical protein
VPHSAKIQANSDYTQDCVKLSSLAADLVGSEDAGTTVVLDQAARRDAMLLRWWDFGEKSLIGGPEHWMIHGN